MRSSSASLNGFITQNGEAVKESEKMCEFAADHFENFFREPDNIYRPHPYTDAPDIEWENFNEEIPPCNSPDPMERHSSSALAKKESICEVTATRPISLLGAFLKVDEKLFLTHFNDLLN
ncbi:unnamed protein product, partial [Rotaria magnacalcarata]